MIANLIKIGLSLLLGSLIGLEREHNDKPAGLRSIMLICLGATLTGILTLEFAQKFPLPFDGVRIIAYYLVAIGFVGSSITHSKGKRIDGITTASILLPVSLIGLFIGLGFYLLATISALCIYGILMLKFVRIKIERVRNGKKKRKN